MVPEFCIPADCPDAGLYEERLCFENVMAQLAFFHGQGCHDIVALDFDDVRARELPLRFRGSRFIILRLVSGDPAQILRRMEHRRQNEGSLYLPERVVRSNEAIRIIDGFTPDLDYTYTLDDERRYLSWGHSRYLT